MPTQQRIVEAIRVETNLGCLDLLACDSLQAFSLYSHGALNTARGKRPFVMTVLRSIARSVFNSVHRPIGKLNLQRAIRSQSSSGVSLEIGANETSRAGWIATDISWRCQNYLDVARTWPIESGSINNIFADNVIEHLGLEANRKLFVEAFRVVKTGGTIRLITPNIGELVNQYQSGLAANAELVEELREEHYLISHDIDLLRFAFQDDGHHEGYLWDFRSLTSELEHAGFSNVIQFPLGVSHNPELQDTDSRVGIPIADVMLAVEARKI